MVTFANGLNFETTVIYAVPADFQGAKRDTLDIAIPADKITLDEAKAIWQNADATSEITKQPRSLNSGTAFTQLIRITFRSVVLYHTLSYLSIFELDFVQKNRN